MGQLSEQLYQVVVTTAKGNTIPVGPRMTKAVIEDCVVAIRKNIADGKERNWRDPQCVPVLNVVPPQENSRDLIH